MLEDELRPYLTLKFSLPALLFTYLIYKLLYNATKSRRIARLGARAPVRTTYFPYGLDMLHEVLTHVLADRNYELWLKMYARWGKGGYTIEAGIGERVILTAEPENVKAVLATQFKDYGKGEKFRKDWYMFLGNGIFSADGTIWHQSRQLIRPQFVKDRLSDLELFEEHVQVLMRHLEGEKEVDVMDTMFK
jgi:cytochrome P450